MRPPCQAGRRARSKRIAIAATIAVVGAAGIVPLIARPPKLTDTDTIVLADFVNNADDHD